jgi:nucleotide-binding universal stress UspA family protein
MSSRERKETAVNQKPMAELTFSTNREASLARPGDRVATILVPLDGSLHALAALPVARVLAELAQGVIHLAHVAEAILPAQEVLHKLGLSARDARDAVVHQAAGDPAEAIARLAREQQSALIVMCMYTGQKEPSGGLGSVGQAVLRTAPCPVVLVPPARGHQPLLLQHILLPYDGTPTTAAALGPALEIAQRAKAELLVLHVVTAGTPLPAEPGSISAPRYVDQAQHEWPAWTRGLLRRACLSQDLDRKLKLRVALAVGEPGAEIVRFARDHRVDLIVLGWHGQIEPARAAVVKAVIRDAPSPLLLLRVASPSRPAE